MFSLLFAGAMTASLAGIQAGYLIPQAQADYYPVQDVVLVPDASYKPVLSVPDATSTLISELWGENAAKMTKVLTCESHLKQWDDDGALLMSSTSDLGIGQVNIHFWLDKSVELGYDITKPDDNLRMAHYIFTKQGFAGWMCSKMVGVI
jgi:hypothetical protein